MASPMSTPDTADSITILDGELVASGFAYDDRGVLLCDGHPILDLCNHVTAHCTTPRSTPFYLYSMPRIRDNLIAWQGALARLPGRPSGGPHATPAEDPALRRRRQRFL